MQSIELDFISSEMLIRTSGIFVMDETPDCKRLVDIFFNKKQLGTSIDIGRFQGQLLRNRVRDYVALGDPEMGCLALASNTHTHTPGDPST